MRLAVLIDAENVSSTMIDQILTKVGLLGTVTVKRVYGDFSGTRLAGWCEVVRDYAIQPIQQFCNISGKSATDGALIIDAMDLLHRGKLEGFCLVSSDSDFIRLVTRIREDGIKVYSFGEDKTPEALRKACDDFTLISLKKKVGRTKPVAKPKTLSEFELDELELIVGRAFDAAKKKNGCAALSSVGAHLEEELPGLRNHVKRLSSFVLIEKKTSKGDPVYHMKRK